MLVQKSPEETKRLDVLSSYGVLDAAPDEALDRITRLAQATFDTPIAMISLVGETRQWIKAGQGISISELPRSTSICAHAIEGNEPLIVPDLRQDSRFAETQLVAGEPHLRFYAGAPLAAAGGVKLGTVSIADVVPRSALNRDIGLLQDLARLTIDVLEFKKMALSDSLTGLCTRRAIVAEADRQVMSAKRSGRSLACAMFDIDGFKLINDTYGTAAGDLILQGIADVCRRQMRKIDVASRIGGGRFILLMPETGIEGAMRGAERLREAVLAAAVIYGGNRIQCTASFGISVLAAPEDTATGLIQRSEQALKEAKHNGRNRTAICAPNSDQFETPQRARIAVRR